MDAHTMPGPRAIIDALEVVGPDREHALTGGRPLGDLEASTLVAIVREADRVLGID